jgi:ParB family chromosome partitioning protein
MALKSVAADQGLPCCADESKLFDNPGDEMSVKLLSRKPKAQKPKARHELPQQTEWQEAQEPAENAENASQREVTVPIEAAGSNEADTESDKVASSSGISVEPTWQVVWLPVAQIEPNPYQPRTSFDPQEMLELVASVRAHGVLQPVTVRTLKPETEAELAQSNGQAKSAGARTVAHYHLVSGERRLRACKESNRKIVPAIIRDDLSDAAVAELALIENVQRSNLNVMEEAAAYKRLMLEFRLKEERLAKKVGKSVQTIKEIIKLLALPKEVQPLIAAKQLSASHGQLLLKLAPFEQVCLQVAQYAAQHKVTATALETAILPNARSLKEQKLLVELGYKTAFDWKNECGNCPFKAYIDLSLIKWRVAP